jgi:hypothetical protein
MQHEKEDTRYHQIIAADTPTPSEHNKAWHYDNLALLPSLV